ncbi:hypothetical protein ACIQXI_03865 [Lysinibacillus sp. NPDC097195]|uniref:hypothetical protein n=1 Tax=Lysinibacillus sp. NPDC097195 TaxID=3364141 RepID=UPI00381FE040
MYKMAAQQAQEKNPRRTTSSLSYDAEVVMGSMDIYKLFGCLALRKYAIPEDSFSIFT